MRINLGERRKLAAGCRQGCVARHAQRDAAAALLGRTRRRRATASGRLHDRAERGPLGRGVRVGGRERVPRQSADTARARPVRPRRLLCGRERHPRVAVCPDARRALPDSCGEGGRWYSRRERAVKARRILAGEYSADAGTCVGAADQREGVFQGGRYSWGEHLLLRELPL